MDHAITTTIIASATAIGGLFIKSYLDKKSEKRKQPAPIESVTDISGSWNIFVNNSNGINPNARLEIHQEGNKVTAVCNYYRKKDGTEKRMTFDYEGIYSAGQLALTFRQREIPDVVIGAVVLKLIDRNKFEGRTSFWHHEKHYLDGDDFKLVRE